MRGFTYSGFFCLWRILVSHSYCSTPFWVPRKALNNGLHIRYFVLFSSRRIPLYYPLFSVYIFPYTTDLSLVSELSLYTGNLSIPGIVGISHRQSPIWGFKLQRRAFPQTLERARIECVTWLHANAFKVDSVTCCEQQQVSARTTTVVTTSTRLMHSAVPRLSFPICFPPFLNTDRKP